MSLSIGEIVFKVDNAMVEAKKKIVAKEETEALDKAEVLKESVVNDKNVISKENTANVSDLTYEELHGSAEKLFKAVVGDHGNEEMITTTSNKEFNVIDEDNLSVNESYFRENAPVDIEEEEKEFEPIITEAYIKATMKEERDVDSMECQNEIFENVTEHLLDI